mmetsp:Transcript_2031/g.3169  ORF Transcript_2031/g.3169 Transcript_2031/m.3169 type:complete len:289 (-) Transcript_2031:1455-2321(-)
MDLQIPAKHSPNRITALQTLQTLIPLDDLPTVGQSLQWSTTRALTNLFGQLLITGIIQTDRKGLSEWLASLRIQRLNENIDGLGRLRLRRRGGLNLLIGNSDNLSVLHSFQLLGGGQPLSFVGKTQDRLSIRCGGALCGQFINIRGDQLDQESIGVGLSSFRVNRLDANLNRSVSDFNDFTRSDIVELVISSDELAVVKNTSHISSAFVSNSSLQVIQLTSVHFNGERLSNRTSSTRVNLLDTHRKREGGVQNITGFQRIKLFVFFKHNTVLANNVDFLAKSIRNLLC